MREIDVIVIGAGSTGENVADYAHRGGLSAMLIESDLVGGECSYWACMPSKALLRPQTVLDAALNLDGAKQAVTGKVDVEATLQRRDVYTSHWKDEGQVKWVDGAGIELIRGHARIVGEKRVDVTTKDGEVIELLANQAVCVSVGSDAKIPPIPGADVVKPWTSREATSAKQAPESLVIIGGGVVGCEMAQAWSGLGSKVTLLVADKRILLKMPEEASNRVQKAFKEKEVDLRLEVKISKLERGNDGMVTVTLGDGTTVTGEQLLMATGRQPRTEDIGLDSIGLKPGDWIKVDDSMRATEVAGGWLYSAGDCNGRVLLTHQGKYQGRISGTAIAARAAGTLGDDVTDWSDYSATADHASVPQVTFTDPEVASVGLTEDAAREAGIDVGTVEYEIGSVAGASVSRDGYDGWAQLVIDRKRDVIVGACFVAPEIAELLHSATVAVVGEVPLSRLWHAVPSYPTVSEVWLRLLETWRQK